MKTISHMMFLLLYLLTFMACKDEASGDEIEEPSVVEEFLMGADLSYVNQIMDHGGIYRDDGVVASPYKIFKNHGSSIVRLRLWHNPIWTKEVYGPSGVQLYNDLADVSKSISLAKAQGMSLLLDIHYSDTWADPGKQEIPEAWKEIKDINVLRDSVYGYTSKIFEHLSSKGLTPEFVQIGNETNCGMFYTGALQGFPSCNVCEGEWQRMGIVVSSAISAVRNATNSSTIKTKTILHVADPKNVEWWFDNMTASEGGNVQDFDLIGISYYPIWHTTVGIDQLSENINRIRNRFTKSVIILETAYPWTTDANDDYHNVFGSQMELDGYPFTPHGQYDFMVKLAREVRDGGGEGVIYWEPAWITSDVKDLWGRGSSWENCALFDFEGNAIKGIDFMKYDFQ